MTQAGNGSGAGIAPKQVVAEFLKAFSAGDIPGVASLLHEDATWWVSGRIDGLSGSYSRQQLVTLLTGVKDLYVQGALRITPQSMIAEGGRVAVEADSLAELKNGRIYNNQYHFLFEIEQGKVRRVKEYMDTLHARDTFIT